MAQEIVLLIFTSIVAPTFVVFITMMMTNHVEGKHEVNNRLLGLFLRFFKLVKKYILLFLLVLLIFPSLSLYKNIIKNNTVIVEVKDHLTKEYIPEITVKLYDEGGNLVTEGKTNVDGVFTLVAKKKYNEMFSVKIEDESSEYNTSLNSYTVPANGFSKGLNVSLIKR